MRDCAPKGQHLRCDRRRSHSSCRQDPSAGGEYKGDHSLLRIISWRGGMIERVCNSSSAGESYATVAATAMLE